MSSSYITQTSSLSDITETLKKCLTRGIPLNPMPDMPTKDESVPHAPVRTPKLTSQQFKLAIKNALRYFPTEHHAVLAPEFVHELNTYGHIYMYRFRPTEYEMCAYPIDTYPAQLAQTRSIMLMCMNNLDRRVAQYPHELITYGGNGCVLSNWAQYHLLMYYLCKMNDTQTLSMYSGHPAGLFPSSPDAPRVVITNGMMIPNYSSVEMLDTGYALGVTMYGQMTAGSYCYIGPQGIVHGTTITILNAGRKYLHTDDMSGKVYVSSGLGGMSGAQGKAGVICGSVTVLAEVDRNALMKRLKQGWVNEMVEDLDACIARIRLARTEKKPLALAYLGNIVDLWERLVKEEDMLVELGSDQTSLHNPFGGGYMPVQLSYEEGQHVMKTDPARFKQLVQESLVRHVNAINALVARGMKFWDYGNSFMLQASRAKADILKSDGSFKYPSYIQEFVGDIFSLGFGPFRWVCTSGSADDLATTDLIAAQVFESLRTGAPEEVDQQLRDNLLWINKAGENQMVVGSQARILYADCRGRTQIALAFNAAIKSGKISGPVVLSRDHHDVSGTDSPYRETSNVYDGSMFCADMSIQNVIGDACRGASWVSIHNGGGCGWGEVMNGGFGLVLDGSDDSARRAALMLGFDVNNGVARRAWAGNENAQLAIKRSAHDNEALNITMPNFATDDLLDSVCSNNANGINN